MLLRLVGLGLALPCTAGGTTLAILATSQRVNAMVCDAGFDYDPVEESCIREEEYFPRKICKSGTLRNHHCTSVTPASTVCPDGFSVKGTDCVQRSTFPPHKKCPPGQDNCLERKPAPIKFTCDFPAYELDGKCVQNLVGGCREGWHLAGDRCVSSEMVCPSGTVDREECYFDPMCPGGQCYVCDREKLLMRLETRPASHKKPNLRSNMMGSLDVCGTQPCSVRRKFISSKSVFLPSVTCMMHLETAPEVVIQTVERTARCTGEGSTDDCYELQQHVVTTACPPNAQLRCSGPGRCQCVAVRKVSGVLGCAGESTLRGKSCVTSWTPASVCAEADTLLKGVCVKVIRKPVTFRSVTVNCAGKGCATGRVASNISSENSIGHTELTMETSSTSPIDRAEPAM
ncbi:MAG: uncharacterized protein KVP18_003282 [Porospora cf. gigantea A]|uniref:uncharacterized protein n=2 Tax=Porospora cf. gigantea A TaxID=2853593 RepID=UPI00355A168D|nr:MAG: hypothetical protein KVP18_003282 [Porospora cf. gigantea A]